MAISIKEPTGDNKTLIKFLKEDSINRNQFIDKLLYFLSIVDAGSVISLDARWGSGKTTIVKQLLLLNEGSFKGVRNIADSRINNFKENFTVFYYNSWDNDCHEDPIQSILYSLLKQYGKKIVLNEKIKKVLSAFTSESIKLLSKGFIDLDKLKAAEDASTILVEDVTSTETRIEALKTIIESITEPTANGKKLLIVIDELDRCKPEFAVRTLEAIKYLSGNSNTIVLTAADNQQLANVIKKRYGQEFDSYNYLNKFYDIIFDLPEINVSDYLKSCLGIPDDGYYSHKIPSNIAKYLNMNMRESIRYISIIRIIRKSMESLVSSRYKYSSIVAFLFIPWAFALKVVDHDGYNEFTKGNGLARLEEFDSAHGYAVWIMNNQTNENSKVILTTAYKEIFDKKTEHSEEAKFMRNRFKKIMNILDMSGELEIEP